MANLLKETKEVLEKHGKTLEDIVWIGSVEYSAGYGAAEVATDLVIMGKDFYMTRGEYDGSEWWDYHSMDMFKKPEKEISVIRLTGGMWDELKDMQYKDKYQKGE